MPDPATEQADHIFSLWRWAWVAALITGVIVWGLIFWVGLALPPPARRRGPDPDPLQPAARDLLHDRPDHHGGRVLLLDRQRPERRPRGHRAGPHRQRGRPAVVAGPSTTPTRRPWRRARTSTPPAPAATSRPWCCRSTRRSQFNLYSPDVIHSFGIPGFLMRMDVVPGRINHFEVTPDTIGEYRGKCYELCGVYHSRMLFNVRVVSAEEYDAVPPGPRRPPASSPRGRCCGNGQAYTQAGPRRVRRVRGRRASDRDSSTRDDGRRAQAAGPAGRPDPHHDRPQADRQALPRHLVRAGSSSAA